MQAWEKLSLKNGNKFEEKLELSGARSLEVAGPAGFEPATPGLKASPSAGVPAESGALSLLSYGPMRWVQIVRFPMLIF